MTYKEARVYLDRVSKYGSVLGLDTIRELLHELGDPQKDLKFIHIAGTNGKGSVLAYTSSVLSEAGYRTGRYVSPTVISYLERIQIDGAFISEEAFARLTEKAKQAIARMEAAGKSSPTVFEVETAIAFLYFKEEHCDLVVLECGMGGEGDATNIIPPPVCAVFTSIGLDHLGVLGDSLEEIARTKAGIIKAKSCVVSAPQRPEVLQELQSRAGAYGCPFYQTEEADIRQLQENYRGQTITYRSQDPLYVPLTGKHQAVNAATALNVISCLRENGYSISKEAVQRGLHKVQWFGRFTCLQEAPLFFIDGAHNPPAVRCLAQTLRHCFPGRNFILIMGVFKDKEYDQIARIMTPLAKSIHTVTLPDVSRSLPAAVLKETFLKYCPPEVSVTQEPDIRAAVSAALSQADAQDIIVAFGSLSYLGETARILNQIKKGKEE